MYEVAYKVWTMDRYYDVEYKIIVAEGYVTGETIDEAIRKLPDKVRRWGDRRTREIEVRKIGEPEPKGVPANPYI